MSEPYALLAKRHVEKSIAAANNACSSFGASSSSSARAAGVAAITLPKLSVARYTMANSHGWIADLSFSRHSYSNTVNRYLYRNKANQTQTQVIQAPLSSPKAICQAGSSDWKYSSGWKKVCTLKAFTTRNAINNTNIVSDCMQYYTNKCNRNL